MYVVKYVDNISKLKLDRAMDTLEAENNFNVSVNDYSQYSMIELNYDIALGVIIVFNFELLNRVYVIYESDYCEYSGDVENIFRSNFIELETLTDQDYEPMVVINKWLNYVLIESADFDESDDMFLNRVNSIISDGDIVSDYENYSAYYNFDFGNVLIYRILDMSNDG